MRFEDAVALVSGGGSGIGRATALRLAREGATVVIADINVAGAEETAGEARSRGFDSVEVVRTDVSDEQSVLDLMDYIGATHGKLDVLINNAGIWLPGKDGKVTDLDLDVWHQNIAVNLTSVFLMCKYAIPLMTEPASAIVNVASAAGVSGWKHMDAYTASKGGVISLTRSLAVEYGPSIRVNAVCPGSVRTPLTSEAQDKIGYPSSPMGRVGEPADLAGSILYLASTDASFVTGEVHVVDGGRSARQ